MSDDIPATIEQMKVGVHVKCINKDSDRFGITGVITSVEELFKDRYRYSIKWDDGGTSGTWGLGISFTILPDQPATPEQMVVGARVKCIYTGGIRYGKTGILADIIPGSASPYIIQWDDGDT